MTDGKNDSKRRMVELDALRGIAAALVMLFYFTTRYEQLYGHDVAPSFSLPWGHYGVNLFFMISGFVIFMTLHRVRRPMDFLVSRFSRLFPAYWVAVLVTFLLTYAFNLPEKTVSVGTAAMNLFMIHGIFHIPHVDGVYWTLQIEIIFYCMALALYVFGRLERVHLPLLLLLALRLTYFLAEKIAGIEMSWTLSQLLILPYIAWFVCGIMVYRIVTSQNETPRMDRALLLVAVVQLAVVEGFGVGLLAISLSAVLWGAAKGKLPFLANTAFAWLGAISYTLYLLHENIGWGVILHVERFGYSADLAVILAIAVSLSMASCLTWAVERPAMNWLRTRYRRYRIPPVGKGVSAILTGVTLFGIAGCALAWHKTQPPQNPTTLIDNIFEPPAESAIDCPLSTLQRPLTLLILGQSNAGNHGEPLDTDTVSTPATFFNNGRCFLTAGPAPGATGRSGNPWVLLAPELTKATGRSVILSVLAVEGSQIRDWVEPGELRSRLANTIGALQKSGFSPDFVLWQQGEADSMAGTTRSKYAERFNALVSFLRENSVSAPIIVALSSRCGDSDGKAVRSALTLVSGQNKNVYTGPDTDSLGDAYRWEKCHFSSSGLRAVADLWLKALMSRYILIARSDD